MCREEKENHIKCSKFSKEVYLPKKFTRQSLGVASISTETCLFCGKPAPAGRSLCKASTFGIDANVRQCALKLEDKPLLPKLSAADLIAQDAQYHPQCLVSLYNRASETSTILSAWCHCITEQASTILRAWFHCITEQGKVVPSSVLGFIV